MSRPVPVGTLTNRELREEINDIAGMLVGGPVGSTRESRARITAVMRESARRMRPEREGMTTSQKGAA